MSSQVKLKELHDSKRDLSFLRLQTNKRLSLDYSKARLLAKNERSYFVPFSFTEDEKKAELYYFMGSYAPLLDYLSWGVSANRQKNMMAQIIRTWNTCEERGFYPKCIYVNVDYCFVDTKSGLIKFIYLPLNNLETEDRALHDFLIKLTEHITPKDQSAAAFASKLLDCLRRQSVFSLFKLQQFIDPQNNQDVFMPVQNRMEYQESVSGEMQRDFVYEQSGGLAPDVTGLVLKRTQDGAAWRIKAGKVEVGRAPLHGLAVSQSASVGRIHATLEIYGGNVLVCDCSSKNGTKINGKRVAPGKPLALHIGDSLVLGDEEFRLVHE